MAAEVKGVRARRAEQTRRRMLSAAYELFVAHGYPDTTMSEIAARAGVAVQTVHFTFGTKAALLQHVYEDAVLGGDGPDGRVEQHEQQWYADFRAAADLHTAVATLVAGVQDVLARTAPLDTFVRAASYEREAARIREYTEARRRRVWEQMVTHLATRFGLAGDLEPARATDLLMLLMSPASYYSLVTDCGWTPEQWRAWCRDAVVTQMFTAAPRGDTASA